MTTIKTDYTPYPANASSEIARVLEQLRVAGVSARYYVCHSDYVMAPRRIGDDMFYFAVKGQGSVQIEDREYHFESGDCAHFARGVLHGARANARDPFHIIAIHYTATVYDALLLPQLLPFTPVVKMEIPGPFHEMANILCREYEMHPAGWQRGIEALALRLLLFYVRMYVGGHTILATSRPHEIRRVLPALDAMRKNLHRPIEVGELAALCHLSQPQFRRVFRTAMDAAPLEYLRRQRLQEAAVLLRRTDETVETIAARVGYQDVSFFARSFKTTMGQTPGSYRKMAAV